MDKGGFTGKAMFTYRYSYRPAVWERLLTQAGQPEGCPWSPAGLSKVGPSRGSASSPIPPG